MVLDYALVSAIRIVYWMIDIFDIHFDGLQRYWMLAVELVDQPEKLQHSGEYSPFTLTWKSLVRATLDVEAQGQEKVDPRNQRVCYRKLGRGFLVLCSTAPKEPKK